MWRRDVRIEELGIRIRRWCERYERSRASMGELIFMQPILCHYASLRFMLWGAQRLYKYNMYFFLSTIVNTITTIQIASKMQCLNVRNTVIYTDTSTHRVHTSKLSSQTLQIATPSHFRICLQSDHSNMGPEDRKHRHPGVHPGRKCHSFDHPRQN